MIDNSVSWLVVCWCFGSVCVDFCNCCCCVCVFMFCFILGGWWRWGIVIGLFVVVDIMELGLEGGYVFGDDRELIMGMGGKVIGRLVDGEGKEIGVLLVFVGEIDSFCWIR